MVVFERVIFSRSFVLFTATTTTKEKASFCMHCWLRKREQSRAEREMWVTERKCTCFFAKKQKSAKKQRQETQQQSKRFGFRKANAKHVGKAAKLRETVLVSTVCACVCACVQQRLGACWAKGRFGVKQKETSKARKKDPTRALFLCHTKLKRAARCCGLKSEFGLGLCVCAFQSKKDYFVCEEKQCFLHKRTHTAPPATPHSAKLPSSTRLLFNKCERQRETERQPFFSP